MSFSVCHEPSPDTGMHLIALFILRREGDDDEVEEEERKEDE